MISLIVGVALGMAIVLLNLIGAADIIRIDWGTGGPVGLPGMLTAIILIPLVFSFVGFFAGCILYLPFIWFLKILMKFQKK